MRSDMTDEVAISNEKSITAAAAAAKAEIEVRVLTAKKWPRDVNAFREGIMNDCRRPGFAEIALFHKPIGGKEIVDFSIRFVESAIQHYQNLHIVDDIVYEDSEQAKLRVSVIDVQHNSSISTVAIVDKLVERKSVKADRKVRGMRENQNGERVYLVEATADEFRNALGSERSKLIRDLSKRLLPRDILDECRELVERTLADANAKDPDAAKKKILDKFRSVGVTVNMLKDYMGRAMETVTAADIADLTTVYNALKDGGATWADIMRTREGEGEQAPDTPAPTRSKARDKVMGQEPFTPPPTAETK